MTFPIRPTYRALVAAVALLVAGCSSGWKHASPTTTLSVKSALRIAPTTIEHCLNCPLKLALPSLIPCPKQLPLSLTKTNAGIRGLAKKLVPISAVDVRICKYATTYTTGSGRITLDSHLLASGTLESPAAQRFQDETNRLIEYQGEGGPPTPHKLITFLLTFGNATRQVNLEYAPVATPGPTNDYLIVTATPTWSDEVAHYATTLSP